MQIVALFGEAQKGNFRTAYRCTSLVELSEFLGEPPSKDSRGLEFAIQALLFEREVIYFRVKEEGFSTPDYLTGLKFLLDREHCPQISAICLPGVGSGEIIEATNPVCQLWKTFLILGEQDLYDYLTYHSHYRKS